MIAPRGASSRSIARAIRSTPASARPPSWRSTACCIERVDAQRCVELEPALRDTRDTLAGGLYFERDEVGDCNKFTQGLAAACAAARRPLPLSARRCEPSRPSAARSRAVVTDRDRIAADTVVVAMGSFTAPLLATIGIRVPIYPVKGVSITFPRGALEQRARTCR